MKCVGKKLIDSYLSLSHTRLKRTDLKFGHIGKRKLSLDDDVYKTILLLSSAYAMEVWGSAKAFNMIVCVQRFQFEVFVIILILIS
jgi:hypothetical protein